MKLPSLIRKYQFGLFCWYIVQIIIIRFRICVRIVFSGFFFALSCFMAAKWERHKHTPMHPLQDASLRRRKIPWKKRRKKRRNIKHYLAWSSRAAMLIIRHINICGCRTLPVHLPSSISCPLPERKWICLSVGQRSLNSCCMLEMDQCCGEMEHVA